MGGHKNNYKKNLKINKVNRMQVVRAQQQPHGPGPCWKLRARI